MIVTHKGSLVAPKVNGTGFGNVFLLYDLEHEEKVLCNLL